MILINDGEMCLNNRAINITELEFREELSPSWAE